MQFPTEQSEFDEGEDFANPAPRDRFVWALVGVPLLAVALIAASVAVFGSSDDEGATETAAESIAAVESRRLEQPDITYDRTRPKLLVLGTTPSGDVTEDASGTSSSTEGLAGDDAESGDLGEVGANGSSADSTTNSQATSTTAAARTTTTRNSSSVTTRKTATTRQTTTTRKTTTTRAATTAKQTTTTRQTTTTAAPTTTTAAPTTTTTAAPTTTTTAPTTAPPTSAANSCGSNSEFERIFRDDFNGSSVGGGWSQYHSTGNAGHGLRRHSANSVSDGMLTITAKMENGQIVSGGMSHNVSQKYGKYVARVRTDKDPSKATSGVLLTWPASNVHPRDGENNFYETLVDEGERNPFYTFIHKPFGTYSDQEYYEHHADASSFQIMTMEWTPSRITIKREGPGGSSYNDVWTVNETGADLIPDVPHYMTMQLDAWSHSIGNPVRMQVDYVEVYKYCG